MTMRPRSRGRAKPTCRAISPAKAARSRARPSSNRRRARSTTTSSCPMRWTCGAAACPSARSSRAPRRIDRRALAPAKEPSLVMKGLALAGVSAVAAFAATCAVFQLARADATAELDRFGKAYAVVRASYVEQPQDSQLVEGAISGMLSNLDPHSSYFDPRTFAAMQVKTEGQYGGVGLVIGLEESLVRVIAPIDDTPASKAGLKLGEHTLPVSGNRLDGRKAADHILSIDGKLMTGVKLDDVQDKLRRPAGTKVTLPILREGVKDPFDLTLVRQV